MLLHRPHLRPRVAVGGNSLNKLTRNHPIRSAKTTHLMARSRSVRVFMKVRSMTMINTRVTNEIPRPNHITLTASTKLLSNFKSTNNTSSIRDSRIWNWASSTGSNTNNKITRNTTTLKPNSKASNILTNNTMGSRVTKAMSRTTRQIISNSSITRTSIMNTNSSGSSNNNTNNIMIITILVWINIIVNIWLHRIEHKMRWVIWMPSAGWRSIWITKSYLRVSSNRA